MNLIQVQEHLKDLPMRAIMDYANGKNPQVPPYLALGELNRRKQMSTQAAQPPQGTVKDKIEQEVMGGQPNPMQAAAQGQPAPQGMPQGAPQGMSPGKPQGMPQPQMPQVAEPMPQMAGGGLTALPVGDMFRFAGGGGVVAFAEGDLVVDQAEQAAREAKDVLRQYGLRQQQQDPEGYAAAQQAAAAAEAAFRDAQRAAFGSETGPAGAMGKTMGAPVRDQMQQAAARVQPTFSPDDQSAAETARLARQNAGPPAGIASVAPPAPPMAPPRPAGGGVPAGVKMPGAPTFDKPDADAYENKLAAFKQANPGLAGSEFQTLLDKIAKQDEEDRAKFFTQEKGRTRADFWKSLIDAGEATRGQKGIGSLFGGFGRSAGASQAEADERANAQTKMRREQELGMAKMRAELEAARRAEARGDFEAAFKHKQDAEKIARDLKQTEFSNQMDVAKLQEQARGHNITAAGQNRDPQVIQIAKYLQGQGMSVKESLERAPSLISGAQYESADARKNSAIDKAYQEERPHDPKMIPYMAKTPEERQKMLKENEDAYNRIRARFGASAQGPQADPNAPSSGFGQARPK